MVNACSDMTSKTLDLIIKRSHLCRSLWGLFHPQLRFAELNFVDEYHLIDCFSPLLHTSALLSFELPLSDPLTWFVIITTIVVINITVIIVTILITNMFVQYIYHHICCNVKPDGDRGDGTVRFNQASCCGRLCEVIWNFQFFTNVHLTSGWNVSWAG